MCTCQWVHDPEKWSLSIYNPITRRTMHRILDMHTVKHSIESIVNSSMIMQVCVPVVVVHVVVHVVVFGLG